MKLVGESEGAWQYQLHQREAAVLFELVNHFPFTEISPVKISTANQDPKAGEREKLLNESLAQHREELKKTAQSLLAPGKFKALKNGMVLTLGAEERETLLQILNDIRLGCWHMLGEPADLESPAAKTSPKDLAYQHLMHAAGYFEMNLLEPEG